MTDTVDRLWTHFRWIMWAGAGALLLLPLIIRAPWTAFDFLVMGLLLGTACGAVELGMRASNDGAYRLGAIVAIGAGFLLIWVNLAVGLLGSETNSANLMFLGVLAVAVAGAARSRSDPARLARSMVAAAVAQALAGMVGLIAGLASPGGAGLYEVAMGTTLFCSLWLLSAWLFARTPRTGAGRA